MKQSVWLQADVGNEVIQVKPAGDPRPPKLQPIWIRGREPSKQDVPDHSCPAGPGVAPWPHRRLVDDLIVGSQVE